MTDWQETHRAMVFPWNCDSDGRMNSRFYFDHFDDSSFQGWSAFGCQREFLRSHGVESVIARYDVRYLRELRAGMSLTITAGITRIGTRSVDFFHRMHDVDSGELCATMLGVQVLFDAKTRASMEMPEPIRERLNEILIEGGGELGGSRSPDPPDPPDGFRELRGESHDVHRSLVLPWRCDHYGHMNARWYAHHFEDGRLHLYAMAGVGIGELRRDGLELSPARTRIDYRRELKPNDLFSIRSRITGVGDTCVIHSHDLVNIEDDSVHATMEGTDVVIDCGSREAVELPDYLFCALDD